MERAKQRRKKGKEKKQQTEIKIISIFLPKRSTFSINYSK